MLKDIKVFPREDIEAGILMDLQEASPGLRVACISITDPGCRLARILIHRYDTDKILRLQFHDVSPEIELKRGCVYRAMTPKQAHQAVKFLKRIQDQVDLLAVHCEAGISRSAALAAACSKLLGQDNAGFFSDPYRPNHYVYELLLSAAEGKCSEQGGDPMAPVYLKNLNAETVEVRHADLARCSDTSAYRSWCPTCLDGILLLGRDLETFQLLEYDRCIMCGQQVHYLDIDDLRKMEGWPKP